MNALNIATAPRRDSRHWRQTQMSQEHFIARLATPGEEKDCGGYVFGTLQETEKLHTSYTKSGKPELCTGLHRNKAAVLNRTAITLDADHPEPGFLDQVADVLGDVAWVAYSTWSSTPDAPRYRLVVFIDKPLQPVPYTVLSNYLMARLPLGGWDKTSSQADRLMHWPSAQERDAYELHPHDGQPLDVGAWLADATLEAPEISSSVLGGDKAHRPTPTDVQISRAQLDHNVRKVTAELDDMWDWPVGYKNENEEGWDAATFSAACWLVRIGNSGLGLDEAEQVFKEHCPRDTEKFPADRVDYKWEQALTKAEGETLAPWDTAADDFEPLPADESPESPESPTSGDTRERLIAAELLRLQVREEAHQRFRLEQQADLPPFDLGTLAEMLGRDPEPPARVEELIPWSASTLVVAQRKTGKTVWALNLAHSLLTGEDFLGRFAVRPVEGKVAFLNFEVSGAQLTRWASQIGLPPDRFLLVNLRGAGNPFDDERRLRALGEQLRALDVESIVCDPFGRAYGGDDQNAAGPVQRWLVSLDRFAREYVGAKDLILTAHAGWQGDRARGSSALEDWGDALVYLTKDDSGARYMSADGRDVAVSEDRLAFDPATKRLTLAGVGGRKASKLIGLRDDVLEIIAANPGITSGKLNDALRDRGLSVTNGDGAKVARQLAEVRIEDSGTRGKFFYLAESPQSPQSPASPPEGS